MNRAALLLVVLMVSWACPLGARADDASTTPETAGESEIASSTPDLVLEVATSSERVATSSDPAPLPLPASSSIMLAIETREGTLFDGSLSVSACPPFPDSEDVTVSAYCAIEQSGVTTAWSWYGNDAFIDSLGGIGNDYASSAYWDWFSDLSFGTTALNAHALRDGESLLITLGRMPLRLSLASSLVSTGSTTALSVLQFGFDSNFDPLWEPAASSTVRIDGEPYEVDSTGTLLYAPISEGTVRITAEKDGYLDASPVTVTVTGAAPSVPAEVPSGSVGDEPSAAEPDAVEDARMFLLRFQNPDGSFSSPLLTDWAAIALAGGHAPPASLKRYLASARDSLASATDYERRAMALEALGIDPGRMAGEIAGRFDGTQVGDVSLVNDDIFALIALLHAGYAAQDEIVRKSAAFLMRRQDVRGSWGSTDLTAASIQALVPLASLPGVPDSLSRARGYLAAHEQADGCFGNSFTTSWAIMAIIALGESPDAWRASGTASPVDCLRALQSSDGGFEEGASTDTRIWATAYAVPALEGETWDTVLGSYPKSAPLVQVPSLLIASSTLPVPEATTTVLMLALAPDLAATTSVQEPLRRFATVAPRAPRPIVAAAVQSLPPPSQHLSERHSSLWQSFVDAVARLLRLLYRA